MLDVFGGGTGRVQCDGVSRRGFLRVGALGMAGLTMADVLRARARASSAQGGASRDTAVIQVFLQGGPTHLETYDPKPDAPREIRGEFSAIPTKLPGVSLCELLPKHAAVMDKVALVRSLHHDTPDHLMGTHWMMTGFAPNTNFLRENDRPSVGSIVAKLRGSNAVGLPPYVGIPRSPQFGQASYLGAGYNPFTVDGDPGGDTRVRNLEPPDGLSLDRLEDRRTLLSDLDRIERARDASGLMEGIDHFTAQAYAMVTGPAARRAFDLAKEDPRLRDRYGRNPLGQSCLLARRLVEAGVTFVTITDFDNWDHHGSIFQACRRQLPKLDDAVSALVEDLFQRGLAERVLLIVWGEFGRTPRITNGGRDHWPGAMSALLAGGGLKMGQVVGATSRKGESPVERPVRPEDVLQTVYHVLGIDSQRDFPNDSGRPMPVLNRGGAIGELIG
jgi:uncharacterized protein (DUF1501 family)